MNHITVQPDVLVRANIQISYSEQIAIALKDESCLSNFTLVLMPNGTLLLITVLI